jgi:hypothetical protein
LAAALGKKPLVQQKVVCPEGALRPVLGALGFEEFLDGEGDGRCSGFWDRWCRRRKPKDTLFVLRSSPGLPLTGNLFCFVPGVGVSGTIG